MQTHEKCSVCKKTSDYVIAEGRVFGCVPDSCTSLTSMIVLASAISLINAIIFTIMYIAEISIADRSIAIYYTLIAGLAGLMLVTMESEAHKMTSKEHFYIELFVHYFAFTVVGCALGFFFTFIADDNIESFLLILSLNNWFVVLSVGAVLFVGYKKEIYRGKL